VRARRSLQYRETSVQDGISTVIFCSQKMATKAWWMAERRPTFSVEKVALFCNPASGGTFSSIAIEIIKWFCKIAVAQAKVSYILRPGNTAFEGQLKLVNGFENIVLKDTFVKEQVGAPTVLCCRPKAKKDSNKNQLNYKH
jgi:small nuclear ribonucleoprotein (snRNP)-like protein